MVFLCYYCKEAISSSPSLLIKHIRYFCKSTATNFYFHCGQEGCLRHYLSVDSFKKHLIRDHQLDGQNNDVVTFVESLVSPSPSKTVIEPIENIRSKNETHIMHASNLISSLYSSSTIPRKIVQEIVENIQVFLSKSESVLVEQLHKLLPSQQTTPNVSDEISKTVSSFCNIFENFDTEYKRLDYFKSLGTFVEPEEVVIGQRCDTKKTSTGRALVSKQCTIQILPLKINLQSFFSLGNVLKDTLDYLNSLRENFFSVENITQGSVWKNFMQNVRDGELNLPLIIYYDDFEIGNPLGSHAGVHKLGGLYVSLPCLPPNYVSLLQNIFILALFHASDRTSFGNNVTFQKVFDLLNDLKQNGINVETSHYKGVIKFHVAVVTGDNLGLNGMLGFVESFSANRPCRICAANKDQIRSMLYENIDLLRKTDQYSNDLQQNNVFETGIKEKCAWLSLDGFDLFENVAVDVLHDYLEGACRYVMQFVITHLVQRQKLISVENLMSKIRNFDYGSDSSSTPSNALTIEGTSINMKCSASEMLTLVRYFGLIVGGNVPEENKVWLLYKKLRQLLDKLLSRRIHEDSYDQVKFLVAELNELYCQLTNSHLKPKFHFLTHYPQMLKKFGPLPQIWTMRFEAKHRTSKLIARTSQSRVNICKTIAIKHQLILNDLFLKNIPLSPLTTGKLKSLRASEVHDLILNFQSQDINENNCCSSSWVIINNIQFKLFSIIVLDISESTYLPVFAEVQKIYVTNNGKVIFRCLSLECVDFDDHFFAYEVRKTNNSVLVSFDTLISPLPATMTILFNLKRYVTLRWTLD